jgi:hypothetical protein
MQCPSIVNQEGTTVQKYRIFEPVKFNVYGGASVPDWKAKVSRVNG